jgi:iron complex outermembrane receptor protein
MRIETARRGLPVPLAGLLLVLGVQPAEANGILGDRQLEELSIEELLSVQVTTVAGVAQARWTAPSAIHVLRAEDLRRSGLRSIPEALRMVPGMFVGRLGASGWTVGARGLAGSNLTATRSLVLVDGRVVHDPLFSGTLWDVVDTLLEDVDRIEVIRGPGATLWGVNAMNGVIHVITRSARDTQEGYARAAVGDPRRASLSGRYGGALGDDGGWRVWGKYSEHDDFELAAGGSAHDAWSDLRGGFRLDWGDPAARSWTVLGEAYRHPEFGFATTQPVPGQHLQSRFEIGQDDIDGGSLVLRAGAGQGEPAGWSLQGYYDHTSRQTSRVGLRRDTVDLDFRRWQVWGERHELIWGGQIDWTSDHLRNGPTFLFDPRARDWTTVNAFVQNTTALVPGRLFAMAGTKVTYHEFVGVEAQPAVRLWWTPGENRTLWAAVSRPVRVPSRLEEDGMIVVAYADPGILAGREPTGVVPFGITGDPDLDVEKALTWELGYRALVAAGWEVDAVAFLHDYSRLISVPRQVIGRFTDAGSGRTYGVELASAAQITPRWRLEGSYSHLRVEIDGPVLPLEEDAVPEHLAQLRTSLKVAAGVRLDAALYYADRIPRLGIDAYERLDLGVAWRVRPELELALRGQNLLEAEHLEASQVAVPRGVYLQVELAY